MNTKEMLSDAIHIAVTAHAGQYDKGGNPYILHVLKVMHYLKSEDAELQTIAVLHDIVEDTDITYEELCQAGMSERVISAVSCLTKIKGQTQQEYLNAVLSNKDACLVKLQDLRHNTDIRRLKGVTAKDIERVKKYHEMYLTIKQKLDES